MVVDEDIGCTWKIFKYGWCINAMHSLRIPEIPRGYINEIDDQVKILRMKRLISEG